MKRFTLIELILVVLIIALAGRAAISITVAVSRHGNRSELVMDRASELHDVCEKINSVYSKDHLRDLAGLATAVGSSGGMDNEFGQYNVVSSGYIEFEDVDNSEPGGIWTEVDSTDTSSDLYQAVLKVVIKHSTGPETTTLIFIDEGVIDENIF